MKRLLKKLVKNVRMPYDKEMFYDYQFYLMYEHLFLYIFFELCLSVSTFLLMWLIEGKIGEFCFGVVFITGVVIATQILRKCLFEILKKKNINIENDISWSMVLYGRWVMTAVFLVGIIIAIVVVGLVTKIFT